jgi:hypothetical protein
MGNFMLIGIEFERIVLKRSSLEFFYRFGVD